MIETFIPPIGRYLTLLAMLASGLLTALSAAACDGARAISGDTLELAGKRYCLVGIDAPEPGQRCALANGKRYDCGRIATTALIDLLAGASVRCRPTGDERAQCRVARCTADGFDLSGNMVHTGWALAEPVDGNTYRPRQESARNQRRGLWRGAFETPWDWRGRIKRQ